MSWRQSLLNCGWDHNLRHVYQFGVFTGRSMVDIANVMRMKMYHPDVFWGFDSFEGLPEEKVEEQWQECWGKGDFDARKHFNVPNDAVAVQKTYEYLKNSCPELETDFILVPGYFCDRLPHMFVEHEDALYPEPAAYVDIDVDIYSSTVEVLDFMFGNKLIVPGTIVGYDDWGGSPGWQTGANGQSRAHREAEEKYDVDFELLYRIGDSFPHVHTIFKVHSVRG